MIYNDASKLNTPKTLGYVPIRSKIFHLFLTSLILAVLYTRTHSTIVSFISLFVVLYTICIATKQEAFVVMLGLQFASGALVLKMGSTEINFLIFAYIIMIVKYYFIGKPTVTKSILIVIFIFALDIVNVMGNDDKPYLTILQWVLSFWYMYQFLRDDINLDLNDIVLYFCLGVWTVCIINALEEYVVLGETLNPNMYGKYYDYSLYSKLEGFRGTNFPLRFGMAYRDLAGANGLAFDLALGMCLCLFGLTAKNQKYTKFYIITFLAFFYFGFVTISRGFYIEIAILLTLFFISNSKNTTKFFAYLIIAMLVTFIFVVFVMDNVDILFDAVSDRFDEGNENRGALIENSIKLFFGNDKILLFGAGSLYPHRYGFTAHNMIFDILVSVGTFGSLLYFMVLYKSYKEMYKYSVKRTLFNYIPLIMLISYRMISGSLRDFVFYYFVMICFILTRYNYEGEGERICITSH